MVSSHFNNTARLLSVLIWMLKYSRFTVIWPESLIERVSGELSNFHSGSAKQYEPQKERSFYKKVDRQLSRNGHERAR